MPLNLVIVDDEKSILETTRSNIKKFIAENQTDASIALCTTKPEEVLDYSSRKFEEMNVYILDINFQKNINGLTLGRKIRDREPNAYIIFLTAYIELSMMVFKYRLQVFDFLVKPVSYSDLEDCLKALMEDYSKVISSNLPDGNNFISVKSGYQEYHLPVKSIIYIESFGPKLAIHTIDSKFECYDTLKNIEESINKITDTFLRSHKSFLINRRHIKEVNLQDQKVYMSNGDECLISRNKKLLFKNII